MTRSRIFGVAALGVLFVVGPGLFVTTAHGDCFLPTWMPWGFMLITCLDGQGTATETFACSADSADSAEAPGGDRKYQIIGQCTHWTEQSGDKVYFFKAAATYSYNAPYERAEITESVAVFQDANRTDKLGSLNGQFDCPGSKDPFTNIGVPCNTKAFQNTTGADFFYKYLPLTRGLATPKTGQATGALTTAKKEPYIGVWRSGTDRQYLWQADRWEVFATVWRELARRDLRLVDLETFTSGGKLYYTGVWRGGTDGYYLWRADSWKGFTDKWEELAKQNLRLIDVETFSAGGKQHYIGVWRSGADGHYLWRSNSWKAFADKSEELAKQNLRLVDIETSLTDNERHFIGVWRSGTDPHYLWHAASWKAFGDKWAELSKQGLRLTHIETYTSGNKQHYIGVWRGGSDGHYVWRAKSWEELGAKADELSKQGLRLVDVAKP